MAKRGSSCGTMCRKVWTCSYIFTWLLLIVGLALCHLAIGRLIPPMRDLPTNLHDGFYQVLGFDKLTADSQKIEDACVEAMALCSANPTNVTNCDSYVGGLDQSRSTSTTQKDKIVAAFDSSLASIEKVGNDKYFGMQDLKDTADELKKIRDELNSMNTTNEYCQATNKAYCEMYHSASQINQKAASATTEIDNMINNEMVQTYVDNTDKLVAAHALPYVLVVSMLFFLIFWCRDAACCCSGGSCLGCVALLFHVLFWLVCLTVSGIFAGAGIFVKYFADSMPIPGDVFKGSPTLRDLLDHVEAEYPQFWALVFEPLEGPCKLFANSMIIFVAFSLIIGLYGCCLCLCRPYTDKDDGAKPGSKPGPEAKALAQSA